MFRTVKCRKCYVNFTPPSGPSKPVALQQLVRFTVMPPHTTRSHSVPLHWELFYIIVIVWIHSRSLLNYLSFTFFPVWLKTKSPHACIMSCKSARLTHIRVYFESMINQSFILDYPRTSHHLRCWLFYLVFLQSSILAVCRVSCMSFSLLFNAQCHWIVVQFPSHATHSSPCGPRYGLARFRGLALWHERVTSQTWLDDEWSRH